MLQGSDVCVRERCLAFASGEFGNTKRQTPANLNVRRPSNMSDTFSYKNLPVLLSLTAFNPFGTPA